MTLAEMILQAKGKIGKLGTSATTALWGSQGPQLAPGGLGAQWQAEGAGGLSTEDRIKKSIEQTGGGIAAGDYNTAQNLGLDSTFSRGIPNVNQGNGGILTNDQVKQNSSRYKELKDLESKGDLNPAQKTELENLEKPNPNPTPDNNTVLDELRRERDRQLADLEDAFNMANRYASDARDTLGRRRKGFEEDYSNSAADIYNQFGADRAGLQTSAEGQDARTTRGLLAQGIGGSGLQEALRRNEAARQQNYGQVREGRLADERINERNKNERMSWADEQDAAINRYLEQAAMQREQGRRTTLDNFSNTLGRLIQQAQAAANALQLSGQDIGSTQIAGIPLAGLTNGTFLNDLQQAYQGSLGGNQSTDTNVNMNLENLPLTEQEKRRRGLL